MQFKEKTYKITENIENDKYCSCQKNKSSKMKFLCFILILLVNITAYAFYTTIKKLNISAGKTRFYGLVSNYYNDSPNHPKVNETIKIVPEIVHFAPYFDQNYYKKEKQYKAKNETEASQEFNHKVKEYFLKNGLFNETNSRRIQHNFNSKTQIIQSIYEQINSNKIFPVSPKTNMKTVAVVYYSNQFGGEPDIDNYAVICEPAANLGERFLVIVMKKPFFLKILNYTSFDRRAMIIHFLDYSDEIYKELVDLNVKNDIFVRYVMESPFLDQTNEKHLSKFHQDMSYRSGSDIFSTYSVFQRVDDQFKPVKVSFKNKKSNSTVLFINSNCGTNSKRETFIQKLMDAGLNVDCLGNCLKNFPDEDEDLKEIKSRNFEKKVKVASKYKFYIAIENALCEDYITEKLGIAIAARVVPIVNSNTTYKFPNYNKLVPQNSDHPPEHSYINLGDFDSAISARDYIQKVANNETLYNSYLWYRNENLTQHQIKEIKRNMYKPIDHGSSKNNFQPYSFEELDALPYMIHTNSSLLTCKYGDKILKQPDEIKRLDKLNNRECVSPIQQK